ncbi:MAG: glycosyltransferase [Candidatus Krumholzibacteriia bacterium]
MKRKTVSLCMIARDEEASIGRAIKSALALVDEIVVVDTGSRDNTRIIAEGYGARILDEVWHDDFAAARNSALAAAACDWILVLDCDEQLQSIRPVDFQRLLTDPGVAGYRLQVADGHDPDQLRTAPALRLFRNHPDVRYRYPVRELVEPSLVPVARMQGQVIVDASLLLLHDPGHADQRSRKRDRNLRLLRDAMQAQPQEPYFAHQLGREALQWLDGEVLPVAGLDDARRHLEAAWCQVAGLHSDVRSLVSFGPQLAVDLAETLLAAGEPLRARAVISDARRWWADDPQLLLCAVRVDVALLARPGCAGLAADELAGLAEANLEVLHQSATVAGAADARVLVLNRLRLRGDLAFLQHRVSDAAEAYEQALAQDQDYAAAWVGLADCARVAGDRKRALRLYLRAITASEWCVQAWLRGGDLLDDLGFHDNAASWRLKLHAQFPGYAGVEAADPVPVPS